MAAIPKAIAGGWNYPPARRTDFRESIHGRELADPFHWLEGEEQGDVVQWMAAEQALTDSYVASDPGEAPIRDWLASFLDKAFVFHSFDAGDYHFMLEERPGSEQPLLLRGDRDGGNVRVAVDPNVEAIGGHPAILDQESIAASPSGRFVAYSLRSAESVGAYLFVRDMETGALEQTRFPVNILPRVSWHPRGHGFYYNQCQGEFIAPEERAARADGVYWHTLGAPASGDRLVRAMDWPEAHAAIPAVTDDGRYLFVNIIKLVANVCRLRALPLDAEGAPCGPEIALARDGEAGFCFIGAAGGLYCFETDLDAPNGRVVGFDPSDAGSGRPVSVVEEQALPLSISPRAARAERSVAMNGRLYLTYTDGGAHVLREFDPKTGSFRGLPLPPGTAVAGTGGDRFGRMSAASTGDKLIIDLWRHTAPPISLVYDPATDTQESAAPNAVPRELSNVVTEQVRYRSKDGTMVPMTILSLGEIPRDASRPCLLYGYGGWGMSIVPEFGLDIAAWLALGGVYAVANIRGGGELGKRWHEAGKGANKQNVFDDFIAAAEYLIAENIAHRERLAIRGLSNGGLLTGACVAQRPDLFAAVISELPLLDPLRMGRDHWSAQIAPELGNPTSDPKAFEVIARYSPLENLRDGVAYPPILVVAADKDSQLLMDGARKFVATLQSGARDGGPYLLHIVRDAAHGGWTKSQQIDTASREIAFLCRALGVDVSKMRGVLTWRIGRSANGRPSYTARRWSGIIIPVFRKRARNLSCRSSSAIANPGSMCSA